MLSTKFLVDTNVLSELVRKRPDPGVLIWAQEVRRVAISIASIEEVYFGLSWKPNPRIQLWFEGFLETNCEALPVTAGIAKRSGEIRGAPPITIQRPRGIGTDFGSRCSNRAVGFCTESGAPTGSKIGRDRSSASSA
ncbi:MAG TPA: PIN domain-containing protein [Thermoanaerobaculia bacterium]|jgi:hypothetical protein|nr:PIN domain-containing protein [Thermoanaerobaculia bacterium]